MYRVQLFVLLVVFVGTLLPAEVGTPSEPVGNATDRAVVEKPVTKKKTRGLASKDQAHKLAHKHPKKKTKTARKAGATEEKL